MSSSYLQKTHRCAWCGDDPAYIVYHDEEWGVPLHDECRLFEMLILEGPQAGLSWITILKRREGYRKAYEQFDAEKVARYEQEDVVRLLADPGIIRNRLKVQASIKNARGVLAIREQYGSLDAFLWRYVDGTPIKNRWKNLQEVPAETALSKQLSKDLKAFGMSFVGPTICYALMQSIGMVNDHTVDCFRYGACH